MAPAKSLAFFGSDSATKLETGRVSSCRVTLEKETRRKPLGGATYLLWSLNAALVLSYCPFDGCTNAHLPHRSDSSSLDARRRRPPRQRLRCVLSMFSSLRVKVPAQPDG